MNFRSQNLHVYGTAPYSIAVIHGGPGAAGEMAPVARELSPMAGIIEPLQSACSIEGQIGELHSGIKEYGRVPLILIGHSWGAWLSWIFTARYPDIVGKLILVASGPFEEKYARGISVARLNRLSENERAEVFSLMEKLHGTGPENKNEIFTRFGNIVSKADTFDALPVDEGEVTYDAGMYQAVWREAEGLRHSGELLELGRKIRCPVIAIHGDYDPHPADGVEKPLRHILHDFTFNLLNHCGHRPWAEKQAREKFYRILRQEITNSVSP